MLTLTAAGSNPPVLGCDPLHGGKKASLPVLHRCSVATRESTLVVCRCRTRYAVCGEEELLAERRSGGASFRRLVPNGALLAPLHLGGGQAAKVVYC